MSRGHIRREILEEYSLEQINRFTLAARNNLNEERKTVIMGLRVAFHGQDKDFEHFMKSFEPQKTVREIKNKPVTSQQINAIQGLLNNIRK